MQWGDGIPRDGTSRKMREYQIRFCEKLSVKFTGLTRQPPLSTRYELERALHHPVTDRRNRKDADLVAILRYFLPPGR